MTVDQSTGHRRAAATARSILSCPADVHLTVDGVDDVTDGLDADVPGGAPVLRMTDADGRAGFSCPPGSTLARAAVEGRRVLLTVESGLGAPGSPDRAAVLTLAGRLHGEREACPCCDDPRTRVTVRAETVVLSRRDRPREQQHVPLPWFDAADHQLNRGFLQRSAEHANDCHQAELRHVVAASAGVPVGDVAGVGLGDLRPDRVEMRWVDRVGAHRRVLHFPRSATTTRELGELLREELHAGLC